MYSHLVKSSSSQASRRRMSTKRHYAGTWTKPATTQPRCHSGNLLPCGYVIVSAHQVSPSPVPRAQLHVPVSPHSSTAERPTRSPPVHHHPVPGSLSSPSPLPSTSRRRLPSKWPFRRRVRGRGIKLASRTHRNNNILPREYSPLPTSPAPHILPSVRSSPPFPFPSISPPHQPPATATITGAIRSPHHSSTSPPRISFLYCG